MQRIQEKKARIMVQSGLPTGLQKIPEHGKYSAAKCTEIQQLLYGKHVPEITSTVQAVLLGM